MSFSFKNFSGLTKIFSSLKHTLEIRENEVNPYQLSTKCAHINEKGAQLQLPYFYPPYPKSRTAKAF